jgi:hypothetical protein
LGCSASLDTLHYVQPCCAPSLYPSELASHTAFKSPAVIEDDLSASGASDKLIWSYPHPKCLHPVRPLSLVSVVDTPLLTATLNSVSAQLCSLADAVSSLTPLTSTHPPHDDGRKPWYSPVLAATMSREEIKLLLHCKGSSLPSVCPRDTANALDTKIQWTAEELHRTMGCLKFCNYKLCSKSVAMVNGLAAANFLPRWAHLLPSQKPSAAFLLTKPSISTYMQCIWTLRLAIATLSEVSNAALFLWTMPPNIIRHLA